MTVFKKIATTLAVLLVVLFVSVEKFSSSSHSAGTNKDAPGDLKNDPFDFGILQAMAAMKIEEAMLDYKSLPINLPLSQNHLAGGPRSTRKKILIVAVGRSGSSFLGDLINSVPGSFYSFEPLFYLDTNRDSQMQLIKSIFDCKFPVDYLENLKKDTMTQMGGSSIFVARNWRTLSACQHDTSLCYQPDFVGKICSLSRISLAKVVRLRVKELEQSFIREPTTMDDWKIIYLVRDPRGVMSSRVNMTWCKQLDDVDVCPNPGELCAEIEDDLLRIEKLKMKNPKVINIIKFEEFTSNVRKETEKLFEFLELPVTRSVLAFLKTHTESDRDRDNTLATFRHTKQVASSWKKKLTQDDVTLINNSCQSLLKRLDLI